MRTAIVVVASLVAALAIGFVAGFWMGSAAPQPAIQGRVLSDDPPPAPGPDAFARLAAERAWSDLVDRLEELQRDQPEVFASERLRLLSLAAQLADRSETNDAVHLVSSYVLLNPRDAQAQFLLSDLFETDGRAKEAWEPLFAILDFPPDQDTAVRARRKLELLIDAMIQQLAGAGDVGATVDLYQSLVLRAPGYDKYRLGLVRWLVRSGRYDEAGAEFKEVGNVGVSPAEVDAVHGELMLAQSELPVTRQGHMLFADLYVAGTAVRMLVDTGASRTGLRPDVLRRVGATDLGQLVQIRTAGGLATVRVHRVRDLTLGEMRLDQLDVLALDALPAGVEGLLGMDVLSAYPRLDL